MRTGWLNPRLDDASLIAQERAVTEIVHHLVNPRVNNTRNEGADLIEIFPEPSLKSPADTDNEPLYVWCRTVI